ncbi:MAG TPA: hypothetical protein VIW73_13120 [Candidatus Cybelea sp.]
MEGITGANRSRIATITENGHTWTELIVVKAPDKLLIRSVYPWMHFVRYLGFDGKRAWTSSSFGGGGMVEPSVERYIISTLAWYTSADTIPGRWPVKLARLPDRVIDGRSYFAIEETPRGGNPSTLLVAQGTFKSAGESSRPGRYLMCMQRSSNKSICTHTEVISDGRVVGSVDVAPVPTKPDDVQFEMPQMLDDWTTSWLLQRYAAALGSHEPATQILRGDMHQVVGAMPTAFSTQWQLQTTRPQAFAISQTYGGREYWRLAFDGKTATAMRLGKSLSPSYLTPIFGMAFNHCEIHATECGVRVTRLANVGLDGRWWYALGVTSLRDPALWYDVLLDPDSGLPSALWLQGDLIYLADYAADASGRRIPATWTTESMGGTFVIRDVKEIF